MRVDRGRALAILPLQDAEADALLAELPEDERMASWRLVSPDGSLAGRGAGVPDLLGTMRLTRPLGRALRRVPPGMLDRAYLVVAGNRGRIGRIVPNGPAPRRYP